MKAGAAILARMAEPQEQKLKLGNDAVTLRRGIKLMDGGQELGTGDHMHVEYGIGNTTDAMILQQGGSLKIKKMIPQIQISTSSPAISASSNSSWTLGDLSADVEKRLLAIYKMFPNKS